MAKSGQSIQLVTRTIRVTFRLNKVPHNHECQEGHASARQPEITGFARCCEIGVVIQLITSCSNLYVIFKAEKMPDG
jgi:hypothetical protein